MGSSMEKGATAHVEEIGPWEGESSMNVTSAEKKTAILGGGFPG